jgi:hypothetical protein
VKVRRGAPRREGERGIALILTLLVLLILLAVVSQLSLSTRLDYQAALARSTLARMDRALEGALEDAYQVLKDDSEGGGGDPTGLSDLLGGPAGGGGGGGNPFANLGAGGGGGSAAVTGGRGRGGAAGAAGGAGAGGGAGGAPEGSYDCSNDSWAKPARQTHQDIEITVVIEDENRKFNLLSILSSDEEFARQSRERLIRIFDTFREGTPDDVDLSTAETLVRNLESWFRGEGRDDDLPRPRLLSNAENSPITLPVTGDELLLVEGFDEKLLYDFRSGDLLLPGLLSHVTVWTSLEVAPEGSGEEGATASRPRPRLAGGAPSAAGGAARPGSAGGGSPAGGAGAREGAGTAEGRSGAGPRGQEGEEEEGGGVGTSLGGAINVNTAPRAVLASLLPSSEIPAETVEAILRYRNERLETEETEEPTVEEELGLEEEEPPRKYFTTLDEMDQIPEFGNLYPEVKQRFKLLLTTQSEVFTIWLTARIPPPESEMEVESLPEPGWEEDRAGITRRVRAVVLRRSGDQGTDILPLLRWELRGDRRYPIPDFPEEELERIRR